MNVNSTIPLGRCFLTLFGMPLTPDSGPNPHFLAKRVSGSSDPHFPSPLHRLEKGVFGQKIPIFNVWFPCRKKGVSCQKTPISRTRGNGGFRTLEPSFWAAVREGVRKREGNSLILLLFASVCVCSRLRAFTCVCGRCKISGSLTSAFVCVCARSFAFANTPFYYTPFCGTQIFSRKWGSGPLSGVRGIPTLNPLPTICQPAAFHAWTQLRQQWRLQAKWALWTQPEVSSASS